MMTSRHLVLTATLTLLTGLVEVTLRGQASPDRSDLSHTNGNIRRPPDYRDRYQLLGVYTVLDPKGNEMHYTFASPGAAEFYRKNGRFADGTVLIKEVLATSHARLTTGDAHWADSTKVWFVMMKDDKVKVPMGFRAWVCVGAPLTPNGLNNGMAGFPEYHHVYVEKKNVDAYLQTGVFPEGTVIVKELTRVLTPVFPDGSRKEPSGR